MKVLEMTNISFESKWQITINKVIIPLGIKTNNIFDNLIAKINSIVFGVQCTIK
jgi:hypothetical protein